MKPIQIRNLSNCNNYTLEYRAVYSLCKVNLLLIIDVNIKLINHNSTQPVQSKMSVLTATEREEALSQLTTLDKLNATLSQIKFNTYRKRVPIQTENRNEIWVAVDPLTKTVSTNVPQPNPKRLVLCSSESKYGSTCYCYADQLPVSIACTIIWAIISAIVLTPLSLICFIPMIQHLQEVCIFLPKSLSLSLSLSHTHTHTHIHSLSHSFTYEYCYTVTVRSETVFHQILEKITY